MVMTILIKIIILSSIQNKNIIYYKIFKNVRDISDNYKNNIDTNNNNNNINKHKNNKKNKNNKNNKINNNNKNNNNNINKNNKIDNNKINKIIINKKY